MTRPTISLAAVTYLTLLFVLWLCCLGALILSAGQARAHDAAPSRTQPLGWRYGFECCSLMDCREIGDTLIDETPKGYVYTVTGELIPYGDKKIKQSKDEFYHLCTKGGGADTAVICLYTPNRGI